MINIDLILWPYTGHSAPASVSGRLVLGETLTNHGYLELFSICRLLIKSASSHIYMTAICLTESTVRMTEPSGRSSHSNEWGHLTTWGVPFLIITTAKRFKLPPINDTQNLRKKNFILKWYKHNRATYNLIKLNVLLIWGVSLKNSLTNFFFFCVFYARNLLNVYCKYKCPYNFRV